MLAPPRPRSIQLSPIDGGFDVEVLPPFAEGASFDQSFPTYKAARGYAGGLRLCLGLPLVDLCGEPDGKDQR